MSEEGAEFMRTVPDDAAKIREPLPHEDAIHGRSLEEPAYLDVGHARAEPTFASKAAQASHVRGVQDAQSG